MKERPILFSGVMVRAILAGAKTQTRIPLRPAPTRVTEHLERMGDEAVRIPDGWRWKSMFASDELFPYAVRDKAKHEGPFTQGDKLWVREGFTWIRGNGIRPWYRADGEPRGRDGSILPTEACEPRWASPVRMPRRISRIALEVTEVRVERLHAITEDDARWEGIAEVPFVPDDGFPVSLGYMVGKDDGKSPLHPTARDAFEKLWDSINAEHAPWASNPWVFAITFRRLA